VLRVECGGEIAAPLGTNDEHRWRRYLIAFARLEEALEHAQQSWNGPTRFGDFIQSYQPTSYHSPNLDWVEWRRARPKTGNMQPITCATGRPSPSHGICSATFCG
jgi:hypothetical protein